jgi:hypothetical protein
MQQSHWIFQGKTKNGDGMACMYSCGDFVSRTGTWGGVGYNLYWQGSNRRREFLVGKFNSRYWICTNAFSGKIQNLATNFHPEKPRPNEAINKATFRSPGHAVAQLVEALRYKSEGREFDPRWCHWNFSLVSFFRPHYGPGVDSASNRNEYQECFLGVNAAGA